MTSLTPGKFSRTSGSAGRCCLPVMPMAVRFAPGIGCALQPDLLDVAYDRFDLFRPGAGFHDDEHRGSFAPSRTESRRRRRRSSV